MIAKIIVHGRDRSEAISRMKRALSELVIDGVDTNADFLYNLLEHEEILSGRYNTGIIESILRNVKQ